MTQTLDPVAVLNGDYVSALTALLEQVETRAKPARQSTKSKRKAAHRDTIEDVDLAKLAAMRTKMAALPAMVAKNVIDMDDPGELSMERAEALMAEALAATDAVEFLEVRGEMIKAAVFAHIDAELRAKGVADPENTNGTLPVPALGKKFCREGAGRTAAALDEQKLQEALGEHWQSVCRTVTVARRVISKHVELVFDPHLLLELVDRDPDVLDAIEDCLIPAEDKSARLTVQDL